VSDEPAEHFWVNGVVAVRDKMPYIEFSNENGMIAQLTIAQAQQVARDILVMAARTEMDAMVLKFFDKQEFPEGAGAALMTELREFRAAQDAEEVVRP
jgi:flagellar biosynthesis regulator FlbT